MGDGVECAVHKQLRSRSRLVRGAAGTWQCRADTPCDNKSTSVKCELCGQGVGTSDRLRAHMDHEHGDYLRYSADIRRAARTTRVAATEAQVAFGHLVAATAQSVDGGGEVWERARRCAAQLEAALRLNHCRVDIVGANPLDLMVVCGSPAADADRILDALKAAGIAADRLKKSGDSVIVHAPPRRTAGVATSAALHCVFVKPGTHHPLPEDQAEAACRKYVASCVGAVAFSRDRTHARLWRVEFASAADAIAAKAAPPTGVISEWIATCARPDLFYAPFTLTCCSERPRTDRLLHRYFEQLPEARVGTAFLRRWGELSGAVDPQGTLLSTDALTLMWIAFLMARKFVDFVDPSTVTDDADSRGPIEARRGDVPAQRLGAMVEEFFRHYACEFSWSDMAVAVGAPSGTRAKTPGYGLCVLDPCNKSDTSCCCSLSPMGADRVCAAFAAAVVNIASGAADEVLLDRTPASAEDPCLSLLGRALVGVAADDVVAFDLLLNKMRAGARFELVDYQAANAASSLAIKIGLRLSAPAAPDGALIVTHQSAATVIPAATDVLIAPIEALLREHRGAWFTPHPHAPAALQHTNLRMIFFEDKTLTPLEPRLYLDRKNFDCALAMYCAVAAAIADLDPDMTADVEAEGPETLRYLVEREARRDVGDESFDGTLFANVFADLLASRRETCAKAASSSTTPGASLPVSRTSAAPPKGRGGATSSGVPGIVRMFCETAAPIRHRPEHNEEPVTNGTSRQRCGRPPKKRCDNAPRIVVEIPSSASEHNETLSPSREPQREIDVSARSPPHVAAATLANTHRAADAPNEDAGRHQEQQQQQQPQCLIVPPPPPPLSPPLSPAAVGGAEKPYLLEPPAHFVHPRQQQNHAQPQPHHRPPQSYIQPHQVCRSTNHPVHTKSNTAPRRQRNGTTRSGAALPFSLYPITAVRLPLMPPTLPVVMVAASRHASELPIGSV